MIKRSIFSKINNHLNKPEISLITGPRQSGKTTLMFLLKEQLDKENKKTLFFSLDNDLDSSYFESQESLLRKIKLESSGNKVYVFIDEIQRKEDAGLFLKGIYDRNLPYKFIVSGSGSVELKEKVHESLVGRKRMFELKTLSFRELVNYKTNYLYEEELDNFFKLEADRSLMLLKEYLSFGGYPRVVLAKNKEEKQAIMTDIYSSYLEKDIAYLLKIKKIESLTQLVRILATQAGSLVNISELSSTLGISIDTVNNYLWYLEKTFIIKKVTPFFKNLRKEITKTPMYYFNDLGFKNYASRRFGVDDLLRKDGHLFENYTYLYLSDLIDSQSSIHFWRTQDKAEVDFVIDRGDDFIPVEVKFTNLKDAKITRSFRSFLKKYQPNNGYVIHLGKFMNKKIDNSAIKFLPYSGLSEVLN